jgi:hypothetical protein
MNYATTQAQAKDRVIIKRNLRRLGATFGNDDTTIDLALALRKLEPSFVFPVNISIDLHDYDRVHSPKFTASQIDYDGGSSQLNQATAQSIQNLADDLAFYLNDGWDQLEAISHVLSTFAHNTPFVKELILRSVGLT